LKRNLKINFFLCLISLFLTQPLFAQQKSQGGIPPKVKAFLGICAYGTVGGALLGFASLAFQENPKAIAQGASLGLYMGIIFGSVVVSSHRRRGAGPIEPEFDPYGQEPPPGFGSPFGSGMNPYFSYDTSQIDNKRTQLNTLQAPLYVPVISFKF
jgi:hypothetical protein